MSGIVKMHGSSPLFGLVAFQLAATAVVGGEAGQTHERFLTSNGQ